MVQYKTLAPFKTLEGRPTEFAIWETKMIHVCTNQILRGVAIHNYLYGREGDNITLIGQIAMSLGNRSGG